MMTAQPVPGNDGQQQGLMWQLLAFGPEQVALHAGDDPGASALACVVPGRQIGLLVFANASGNGQFGEFRSQIVNRLMQRAAL